MTLAPLRALRALQGVLALDLRAVSLFRVLLAFAALLDLGQSHLPWFALWYGDQGLLSHEEAFRYFRPTFPLFYGPAWLAYFLLALLLLALLAFALGVRPRQAAVTAGFLLLALYDRNPLLLNTGHALVPALLLLSAFLPLRGSFGWEAALTKGLPQPGVAWGLLPFLVMGFFAYFLNAVIKDFHGYFVEGSAAFYALRSYGTDLGYALSFLLPKEVLVFLSRYVYVVEASAPFLLLLPLWEFRLLGTLLLMSLHLGFFLLDIGNFPWVMLAFLALFLPSPFLDWAGRAWRRLWRLGRVRIHYDGGCGFCARISQVLSRLLLVEAEIVPAQGEFLQRMEEERSWVVEYRGKVYTQGAGFYPLLRASPVFFPLSLLFYLPGFPLLARWGYRLVADRRPSLSLTRKLLPELSPERVPLLLSLGAWTVSVSYLLFILPGFWDYKHRLPFSQVTGAILRPFGLDLTWGHFAPTPSRYARWVESRGVGLDGAVYDPWATLIAKRPAGVPPEKVYNPVRYMASEHWRKVLGGSKTGEAHKRIYRRVVLYLCHRWNQDASRPFLRGVNLYRYWRSVDNPRSWGRELLASAVCP